MRKPLLWLVGMLLCMPLFSQNRSVSGKVTDDKGAPIANASIMVKGTNVGTTSDASGNFRIALPAGARVLVISSVGMSSQEISVGTQDSYNVSLASVDKDLEEVVVIGYEIKRKRDIAGATSSVKGGDIAIRPVGSFARAMQGQMSGVQVLSNNGIPGGNVTVRIRGVGSINAGTQPLYIVDGVQLVSGNANQLTSGNAGENTISSNLLNSINPDDIESIDVLKDPASASIYGAQAANGVVIITTKKGKQGKTKVSFTAYAGISRKIKKLEVTTANELAQLAYESYVHRYGANSTTTLNWVNQTLPTIGGTVDKGVVSGVPNYDYQDLIFRNGFTQNYDLSFSGGNEKTTFFFSAGYNKINGHVIASDFQRGSTRLNLDHKINNKLSVAVNLNLSTFTQNGNPTGGAFANPVRSGYMFWPSNAPYNPDGTINVSQASQFGSLANPLGAATYNIFFSNNKRLVGGTTFTYAITPHLRFRSSWNLDWSYNEEKQFTSPKIPDGAGVNGAVAKASRQIRDWQTNQTLNYNRTFNNVHAVSGLAGFEYRYNLNTSFAASGQGVPSPDFTTLSSTATPTGTSEGYSDFKLTGLFAKLGYIYNDKYIANVTIRRDGSSRFGANTKFGVFPAASLAWRISDENFMKRFSNNNELKLRLSYGVTGNQNIGNYDNRALFGLVGDYEGFPGAAPTQLAVPDLSWEENASWNFGLDYSFFGKRITGQVDYFMADRRNLLLAFPLPQTSGYTSISRNVGVLRNRGIEVEITSQNFKSRNFSWTTNLNFTYVKNKVKQLNEGQKQLNTAVVVGRQLNSIYTYKFAGINAADGRPMYYDSLGQMIYVPALRDRYYLDATSDPTWYGGLTNTFNYKGFELRFQVQFQGGNYVQNSDAPFMQRAGSTSDRNQLKSQMLRWQKPGDITYVPRPWQGGTQTGAQSVTFFSDRFWERGDYARLKEVTLTYTLPKSIVSRLRLTGASFYVSALNVYTWSDYTGYDPEVAGSDFGSYPQAKQTTFGVNLNF
jgi:TonB-dependent starch-binding outer membrane protein SusC